jgi:hypothetical protein
MRVILQSWCQIQRTPSRLRYVNCGPGHIQCSYSSAYSGFNIQLNLPALLLEIWRHLEARYTATLVPYIAHNLQFTLCGLWSRTYTMHLQLRIFKLQYLSERICTAIGDMSTIQWWSYRNIGAIYSAHPPVYAMWTVVPHIYNVITAPHINSSIFNWTYLGGYWRYFHNSMSVILQIWGQIHRTSSSLRYVNCGPGHIQRNYSTSYSGFNIRLNVSAVLLETIG